MTAQRSSKFAFSIYLWFLQVVIILGLASLAVWASLIPKTPLFTISNMDFKPFQNKSDITRNSSSPFTLNVTISNPNKMVGVYFDHFNVTVRCENVSVGSRSVSRFYLGHKIIDVKEVELSLNDSENGMCDEKVDFRVGLEMSVRYKIMLFKTKHRRMVFEDYVRIGRDGQMLGTREMKLT